jgi:hypothetical protein
VNRGGGARERVATGDVLAIGAVASLIHLAIFLTVISLYHTSLETYSNKGDGASYKHMAAALLGEPAAMDQYDTRVFPGYPMLIAVTHLITRLSISASALAVTFISAGAAAALSAIVFEDRRIGWAVGLALPHAWINMSLAMSEAPVLALIMLGLLLARRKQTAAGGIIFGLSILTRPVAAFALIGLFVDQFACGRLHRGLLTSICASLVFFIGMFVVRPITGGFFHGVSVYANSPRAYAGQIFTWPMHSIWWMTLYGRPGWWRWIYIIAHLTACIGGCIILSRKTSPTDLLAFTWLALNTLFILCIGLGPGAWGFNHFPRFMIPALPALAYAWRRFLPATPWLYIPLIAVLFFIGVVGVRFCN